MRGRERRQVHHHVNQLVLLKVVLRHLVETEGGEAEAVRKAFELGVGGGETARRKGLLGGGE